MTFPDLRKKPLRRLKRFFKQYTPEVVVAAVVVISLALTLCLGDLVGNLVALIGFVWFLVYRKRKFRRARLEMLRRLETRLRACLDQTMANPVYEVRRIAEWPLERLAGWPDRPPCPAPLGAWDAVVCVPGEEPQRLTLYLDAHVYALPSIEEGEDA